MRLSSVVAISSASRLFHSARTSAEGAQPRIPGWMRPAKRDVGNMAGGAEDAFKVPDCFGTVWRSVRIWILVARNLALRFRIDLIQKSSAVVLGKDTSEAPWLMLEWLDILDLDQEHITGLSAFNLERSGKVVDSCEVNILHIICRVIVANLATGPVHTLDFNDLSILDGAIEGHIRMPSIVEAWLFPRGLPPSRP